jgi:aryl-alcohol dehydrogenase-like predicted oxidoreductase
MEYVTLGRTGTRVSRLCLGTWRFGTESDGVVETDRAAAHDLLDAAVAQGINFIDTANVYGDPDGTSERYIGDWLADRDRGDVVLASKVYFPFEGEGSAGPNDRGLGRKHVREQVAGTLDRLGTDYLDLYYVHRWDDDTPIAETMRTLTDLVREGRVNHLGASTMAAWKLAKALWTSDVEGLERFDVVQPPFDATYANAGRYEGFSLRPYLDLAADQRLAVCPYSPLAGGFLTGKYRREGDPPADSRGSLRPEDFDRKYVSAAAWDVLDAVRQVADDLDATPAQVALAWLLDRDRFETVVPVVGARTPAQIEENAGAVDISLDDAHRDRIAAAQDGG